MLILNAKKYTARPAATAIISVIGTNNAEPNGFLYHIYCIKIEVNTPTIQAKLNTIIPVLLEEHAIANEHNDIATIYFCFETHHTISLLLTLSIELLLFRFVFYLECIWGFLNMF